MSTPGILSIFRQSPEEKAFQQFKGVVESTAKLIKNTYTQDLREKDADVWSIYSKALIDIQGIGKYKTETGSKEAAFKAEKMKELKDDLSNKAIKSQTGKVERIFSDFLKRNEKVIEKANETLTKLQTEWKDLAKTHAPEAFIEELSRANSDIPRVDSIAARKGVASELQTLHRLKHHPDFKGKFAESSALETPKILGLAEKIDTLLGKAENANQLSETLRKAKESSLEYDGKIKDFNEKFLKVETSLEEFQIGDLDISEEEIKQEIKDLEDVLSDILDIKEKLEKAFTGIDFKSLVETPSRKIARKKRVFEIHIENKAKLQKKKPVAEEKKSFGERIAAFISSKFSCMRKVEEEPKVVEPPIPRSRTLPSNPSRTSGLSSEPSSIDFPSIENEDSLSE